MIKMIIERNRATFWQYDESIRAGVFRRYIGIDYFSTILYRVLFDKYTGMFTANLNTIGYKFYKFTLC